MARGRASEKTAEAGLQAKSRVLAWLDVCAGGTVDTGSRRLHGAWQHLVVRAASIDDRAPFTSLAAADILVEYMLRRSRAVHKRANGGATHLSGGILYVTTKRGVRARRMAWLSVDSSTQQTRASVLLS